jgi:hypothetical protein
MIELVIRGLNTPQIKAEAECLLYELGYRSNWVNTHRRIEASCSYISTSSKNRDYVFHHHYQGDKSITIEGLRSRVMRNGVGKTFSPAQRKAAELFARELNAKSYK